MLQDHVIPFLNELKRNNTRDWFGAHKEIYQQAKDDFTRLIDQLLVQISLTDPLLIGLKAKDCIYRIYRDTRFSNDKTPYKTNFGAVIAPGGRKSILSSFYVHIEPGGNSICGGGIYMPSPAILKALRSEFFQVPEELLEILENPNFKKYYSGLWGEKLKTAPQGFPKDLQHLEILKYKNYIVLHEMSDKVISDANLIQLLIEAHKAIYPFNRLLNTIIEDAGL